MNLMQSFDERYRLEDLAHYDSLIDQPDDDMSELARLASAVTDAPMAGVSLVDADTVWLKGRHGVSLSKLAREGAFCAHAVESNEDVFVVNNALSDPRFSGNPLVTGDPGVRYYAAASLISNQGYRLGTLWIMDSKPGTLSENGRKIMQGLAAQAMRLLELRYVDPLTRLANRASFLENLQRQLNRHALPAESADGRVVPITAKSPVLRLMPFVGQQCAVGKLVVRNARLVRSAYGDEAGNALIKGIAERLSQWSQQTHLIARMEADGFAFAIFGRDDETREELEALTASLATPIHTGQVSIRPIFMVGVSHFPANGSSASSLLDQATAAAHQVENTEPSSVIAFRSEHMASAKAEVDFQNLLPGLLAKRQFAAHYQPQVDVVSRKVIGLEALARIQLPALSHLSPSRFIPVAEGIGMIDQIDLLMLDVVCRDLRHALDQGVAVLPVSVNLSRNTLLRAGLGNAIIETLDRHRIAPELIEVELTETGSEHWPPATCERISELQSLGIRVALDDFGAGHSNLATLRSIRFERLKADRAYVHGAASNLHVGGILRFIKNVTDLFQIELVCEGVEDEEDLNWARELGCRTFQGWYFCKALPPEAAMAMLRDLPQFERSAECRQDASMAAFLQSYC